MGDSPALEISCRALSTELLLAPSISTTFMSWPDMIAPAIRSCTSISGYSTPSARGASSTVSGALRARAKSRAIDVLPTPRVPQKR